MQRWRARTAQAALSAAPRIRSGRLKTFAASSGGNVAIIFAFSLVPAIGLIGIASDYASDLMAKRRLDAAADAAVLRAVSRSSNPTLDAPTQAAARAAFDASLGSAKTITVKDFSLSSAYVDGNLQVTVSYKATLPTNFGMLFNVPTMFLSGLSVSAAPIPAYANFYLLLDNSPSMGFGATTDDINRMQKVSGGCAFACHEHAFDNSGRITGDNTADSYHVAKNNGITLRIDVLRSAAQHLFDSAKTNRQYNNQYQAAIYTFSDVLQSIAALSSNLDDVSTQAQNIDLAYSYHDHRDAQTSYDTALTYMASIVPKSGNGLSSGSPISYLFIVTDGIEDEPAGKNASGSNDRPDNWAAPSKQTSPPSDASPNLANTVVGNMNNGNTRLISTFTSGSSIATSQCAALKNNGVKIAILYTAYLPVNDPIYNKYIAPVSNQIPTDLQSCASPNLFFTVTPSQGIDDAMKVMFKAATSGLPRLTQ